MRSRFWQALIVAPLAMSLAFAQGPAVPPDPEHIAALASPSLALLLTSRDPAEPATTVGTAVVATQNGTLLTAYHLLRDAYSAQVRLNNGETFDQVQLLGIDARRDVAAIKIAVVGLHPLTMVQASLARVESPVVVLSHEKGLSWTVSAGRVSIDIPSNPPPEIDPGFRMFEFKSPVSLGPGGGVAVDNEGRGLGLIVNPKFIGQDLHFAIPFENVLGLAQAPISKALASGSSLSLPGEGNAVRPAPALLAQAGRGEPRATPDAPEKSDALSKSKDKTFIVRNFKTMYVDARKAQYFDSAELKGALGKNDGFAKLDISIVDDPNVADTILSVSYVFAWDYPFQLKHQNSTIVLLSGKGYGPFSGPLGAASVASEFVKAVNKNRAAQQKH